MSQSNSFRTSAGVNSRVSQPQRAKRKRFTLEMLEDRRVMAADLTPDDSPEKTNAAAEVATMLWKGQSVEVKPGSWLVSFSDDTTATKAASVASEKLGAFGDTNTVAVKERMLGNRQVALQTSPNVTYEQLFHSISMLPGVRYIEPDFIVKASGTVSNDPLQAPMYALDKIDAFDAWDVTTGSSSVVVGVIDSGVDYTHPDLVANMWRNPGEIAGDGIDNDRNGYRDDVYGYDFANGDGDPLDDNGHGTHVSGTIAAAGNNSVGVTGVSWNSKIMALKFLGSNGSGAISAAVSALNYATMMRTRYGVNIRVTNNSWGGGAYSQAMSDALTASANASMLYMAAAGNSAADNDATISYPSGYSQNNVIAVASSTDSDALSSFSNYGTNSVDIVAPGSSIYSTLRGGGYGSMSGTSMAAPQVSGAAALLLGAVPTATYQQVRDALYQGAERLPAFANKVSSDGRLNVANSLHLMLGDVGNTLSTARNTSLDQSGDRFQLNKARIGDGSSGPQDIDLFRFQVNAGNFLTASALPTTGGVDANRNLRLFNSAGNPLALADNPTDNSATLTYAFTSAGTYYVGVSAGTNSAYSATTGSGGTGGAVADYELRLSLDVSDTLGAAKPLPLGSLGSTRLMNVQLGDGPAALADVDLYRFTATAGTVISAMASPGSGAGQADTALRLFDATGVVLNVDQSNDQSNASVLRRIATTGTYYLGVSSAGNIGYDPNLEGSGVAGSTGDYSLTVTASQTIAETAAEMDLHGLIGGDGSRGISMTGQDSYAELTTQASSYKLGDVSGDGIDDFLVAITGDVGVGPTNYVFIVFGQSHLDGGLPAEVDLYALDGTDGYRIEGLQLLDRTGLFSGGAGDINADGLEDIVIGAIAAVPSSDRNDAGQSYVIFGGQLTGLDSADGQSDGLIQLSNLNGTTGLTINGALAGSLTGRAAAAGDFNADGFDDLIIGGPGANSSVGEAYIVYGAANLPAVIDLATLNGVNGLRIPGLADSRVLGSNVSYAGDLNGDGIADVGISAPSSTSAGVAVGRLHVIFGSSSFGTLGTASTFDLSTLNGNNGFSVVGVNLGDSLGSAAAYGGDVNGDGRDDFLFSAAGTDLTDRTNAGAVYILNGRTSTQPAFPATILATAIEGVWGSIIVGSAADYALGAVGTGGDFNGDGIADMVVASAGADPNGYANAGQTFVVYGHRLLPSRIDLANLLTAGGGDGSNGRVFNGFLEGSGMRANMAGDIDADGYEDLRIGAPFIDINGLDAVGQIYMVYGEAANAGIRLSATSGLTTTEAGGGASVKIVLSRQPTAPVTIPLAVSDATEGSLSVSSITFDETNWTVPQTVTISGVDDSVVDGPIAYTLQLLPIVSQDGSYAGLNAQDVSISNADDDVLRTQFYVVNDASQNRTYEYTTNGAAVEDYALNSGNSTPRGAVASTAGDKVWVVDNNRKVYVYSVSGALLGSWSAGTMPTNAQPEGIATNGTDIWIVDNRNDRVYRYAGAATRLSGSQTAASNFALTSGNTNPKDIASDGASIWVVNDATTDRVYKYSLTGSAQGNWSIDSRNATPTGIAIDPTSVGAIWIVDAGTDQLYRYDGAATRTSGSQTASVQFVLGSGNLNPQGLALAVGGASLQSSNENSMASRDTTTQSASAAPPIKSVAKARADAIDQWLASSGIELLEDSIEGLLG